MSKEFHIPEEALRLKAKEERISKLDVGAGVVRDSRLLLVRRVPEDFLGGFYELPGGGIENGESFDQALRREIKEEIGLEVTSILGMISGFDYMGNDDKSVRQFNFLVEVEEGEIKLAPNEHDHYVWMDEKNTDNIKLSPEMRQVVDSYLHPVPQHKINETN